MRSGRKWYPILLLGLILLLAIPLAGCLDSYTQNDLDNAYQEGYDDGSHDGYQVGYDMGYDIGYDDGCEECYDDGYYDGIVYALEECEEAFENGYYIGYQDCLDGIPSDYWTPAYNVGHDVSDFFIEAVSPTPIVASPGEYVTIVVQTLPYEILSIEVWYMSGISGAQGLDPQRADDEGYVSWTWKVGTNTTPGTWEIIIESWNLEWWCQGYENITLRVDLVVY